MDRFSLAEGTCALEVDRPIPSEAIVEELELGVPVPGRGCGEGEGACAGLGAGAANTGACVERADEAMPSDELVVIDDMNELDMPLAAGVVPREMETGVAVPVPPPNSA